MSTKLTRIKKRDGRIVKYNINRIVNVIFKALLSTGTQPEDAEKLSQKIAKKVEAKLIKIFGEAKRIPGVEDIQDLVEAALLEAKQFDAVKHYIEYRQARREIREEKKRILNREKLHPIEKRFSLNSIRVLASRYLLKNREGQIIESVPHMFKRVAVAATLPELLYDPKVYKRPKKFPHVQPLSPAGDTCDFDEYSLIQNTEVKDFLQKIKEKVNHLPKETITEIHSGYTLGNYPITYGHLERLAVAFDELEKTTGRIKISFNKFLDLLSKGYFDKYSELAKKFYKMMTEQEFMPNSPTLMNAGLRLGQLSACFVVDIEDDITSILMTNLHIGLIFKSGGGVGANYSKLRPEGDYVASTGGTASGPLSFMRIIDTTTDVVKQGGKRRGANMGILEITHPDIEKFIMVKEDLSKFTNFNLSVGVLPQFWEAYSNKKDMPLINPHTKSVVRQIDPDHLINTIAHSAWKSAEPGVLFFDNINKYNVLKKYKGEIRATNPCGEQPLYPYESCNLGSINLAKFITLKDGKPHFCYKKYYSVIRIATHMLDNIITINKYPIPKIRANTLASRKVGLGIMGLANVLYKLNLAYNSKEAYAFMDELAETLAYYSMEKSVELAKEKGAFPLFDKSEYPDGKLPLSGVYEHPKPKKDWHGLIEQIKTYGIRNSYTTTLAPTGSISMIADTSSGLEPQFALVYKKNVAVGSFYIVDPVFEEYLSCKKRGGEKLKQAVADNSGSIQTLTDLFTPEERRVFVVSQDIHWLDHIIAQLTWQQWNSSSISKTINMPEEVTPQDIKQAYLIAHEIGLKGLTIFRDGSRIGVIEHLGDREKFKPQPSKYALEILERLLTNKGSIYYKRSDLRNELYDLIKGVLEGKSIAGLEQMPLIKETNGEDTTEAKEGKCPVCGGTIVYESGCEKCIECGWSACPVS